MEHWAKLIQTVLWIGLIVWIIRKYDNVIKSLLDIIQKRIKDGGGIKIGGVEIPALLKPQDKEEQKKKIDEEVVEAIQLETSSSPIIPRAQLRTQLFQSEDLALRAIQSEFGSPISRQMQAGNIRFDGFFMHENKPYAVEVKFTNNGYPINKIKNIVNKMLGLFSRYNWKKVNILLAFVYDNDQVNLIQEKSRIESAVDDCNGIVEIRCYSYKYLMNQFGAIDNG